jgi:hypothetical protein
MTDRYVEAVICRGPFRAPYITNQEKGGMGSRPYQLKYKYGITEAVYDTMLEEQDGKCAICGTTEPGTNGGTFFAIDHVREPFKIRGLLCRGCNLVLGSAYDSIEILESAIKYLKGHI